MTDNIYTVQLGQQFRNAFGYTPYQVTPVAVNIGEAKSQYDAMPAYEPSTPTVDIITLFHDELGEVNLEMLVSVDASRQKNIRTTIVNENQESGLPQGEVVESYGWQPWNLTLKGILIDNESGQYPTDKVEQLRALGDIHDTFQIYSDYINRGLGIEEIYFTKIDIKRDPKFVNAQPFTLSAKSHTPVEALIIE